MTVVKTPEELVSLRKTITQKIGFVPTMGALHPGHVSLISRARQECECVIVSIFVNPTQFLPGEDLDAYPRKEKADIAICEKAGVDYLFMPNIQSMYGGKDEVSVLAPGLSGYILEGNRRPGHFDGVLRIVMKLLNLVQPEKAFFGKKDAQQLALIQQMVRDLFMNVEIVSCETIREKDGLALSSRNVYLSPEERKKALAISQSLGKARNMIMTGETSAEKIQEMMLETMQELEVEYVAITDRKLHSIRTIVPGDTLLLIAARVGQTRLIDNFWI